MLAGPVPERLLWLMDHGAVVLMAPPEQSEICEVAHEWSRCATRSADSLLTTGPGLSSLANDPGDMTSAAVVLRKLGGLGTGGLVPIGKLGLVPTTHGWPKVEEAIGWGCVTVVFVVTGWTSDAGALVEFGIGTPDDWIKLGAVFQTGCVPPDTHCGRAMFTLGAACGTPGGMAGELDPAKRGVATGGLAQVDAL